jgi:outer membrane protein assembly factor BamA
MTLRWIHTPLFICCLIFTLSGSAQARWFILPGVFYTDEYGVVGTLVFLTEGEGGERFNLALAYFGDGQGEAGINLFLPRKGIEWTFNTRYQVFDAEAYSSTEASDQDALYEDTRYWTDLWIRCDFPLEDGLFYGFEAAYRRYEFGYGSKDALYDDALSSVSATFTEGEEYALSLRAGKESRDNRYDSYSGYYFLGQLDIGSSNTRSEGNQLVRMKLDLRRYFPVVNDKSTLALNLRAGAIHHQVPYFSQFKMGGSFSLRGFPLDRYYGDAYYLARAEYRHVTFKNLPNPIQLFKKFNPDLENYTFSLGFSVFTDLGDLWRHELGWWGVRQGIGAGLRVVFPPSVVASIDIATPVDSDYLAIYLNLEQSF